MKGVDIEPIIIGGLFASILLCVVLLVALVPDNRPRLEDYDWYGECKGDGYWYEEQSHSRVCVNYEGKVSTCYSTIDVFQRDMTEKEYAVYCKGQ